jgi:undecaprenyl diphosphate synthase
MATCWPNRPAGPGELTQGFLQKYSHGHVLAQQASRARGVNVRILAEILTWPRAGPTGQPGDMMVFMNNVPKHVAIIMDGNGRWARARGLARTQGHIEGVKRVDEIVEAAQDAGLKALTLYTFSTENWNRPEQEVSMLMQTLVTALGQKLKKMCANKVRLHVSGRRQGAPPSVLEAFDQAVAATRDNPGLVLNIAFNYGGRQELLDAVCSIARDCVEGRMDVRSISEELFSSRLYTAGIPDPDLLIRTSGEQRISNFLPWQLSYAEFYFTEKYWPDFTREEFFRALSDFERRQRRYGGVTVEGGK